jgi:hypothetical protein
MRRSWLAPALLAPALLAPALLAPALVAPALLAPALLAPALLVLAPLLSGSPATAAEAVTPPAMYPPDTWEGRSAAVVRVLDKLDAHVETLTIPAGQSGSYKSLGIAVRGCLQHPPGLPPDSAAFLTVQDGHAAARPFATWMFSAEPFIAVYESPVFGLQLVSCAGTDVAPAAPPLLPPPPAVPAAGIPAAPSSAAAPPNAAAPPSAATPADPGAPADTGPNPVYPSGTPDGAPPPDGSAPGD